MKQLIYFTSVLLVLSSCSTLVSIESLIRKSDPKYNITKDENSVFHTKGYCFSKSRGEEFKLKYDEYINLSTKLGLTGNDEDLFSPLPMFNLFEGGVHTDKETGMSVQEFMIVPQKKTMQENLVLCNKVFENLKKNLENSLISTIVRKRGK